MSSQNISAANEHDRLRYWAIATAFAGVAALCVVAGFRALPEVIQAGTCAQSDAILRFEVATNHAQLDEIFGPRDSDCRDKVIRAMDAVNTLDVFLFIPTYTAFVAFAAFLLGLGRQTIFVALAVGAALAALLADYVETFGLLSYTPGLAPSADLMVRTSVAAWVKFFMLGINGMCLAALCFTSTPRKRLILGSLMCLPVIGVSMMFWDLKWAQLQTLAFLVSWVPLLLVAGKTAITGRI